MYIADTIKQNLQKAVTDSFDTDIDEIHLEHPADMSHGDYATNIAMQLSGRLKKSPREIAEAIIENWQEIDEVDKVDIAGPGFINVFLSEKALIKFIEQVVREGDEYGSSKKYDGKKVIVEYSSPNIAKPFTFGHLRSTVIGNSIGNILSFVGWKVYRDNHIGDWGTQFGKQIYAIKTWGSEKEIEESERPIKKLVELYVKFHNEMEEDPTLAELGRKWFKRLEEGDDEARRLWKKCVEWSWKEFDKIYSILGVNFTENYGRGYGESFFENKMADVITELRQCKLLSQSEGAELIFFPEEKGLPPLMIIKSDGTSLYATRDLATDKFRLNEYGKNIIVINETGLEQSLYWQQIFTTEVMLGWFNKGQRVHVGHGLIRLKEGRISTRKGNVIWLEDVLEEARKRAFNLISGKHDIEIGNTEVSTMRKVNPQHTLKFSEISNLAEIIAVGALKWNDLKRSPDKDIVFDWEEILNMNGNSGPYLQYTHARCASVLKKSDQEISRDGLNLSHLTNEEEQIIRLMYRFPEVVIESAEKYAPNVIANYLYELAQSYNSFYNSQPILQAPNKVVVNRRLLLTQATKHIIKNGLYLLGIEAPDKM